MLPPKLLASPDPQYSEPARRAKYQGTSVLWLVIDREGNSRDIRIARPTGFGLDEQAIAAVKQWHFQPAMKDGQPVDVQINIEVNFRLY